MQTTLSVLYLTECLLQVSSLNYLFKFYLDEKVNRNNMPKQLLLSGCSIGRKAKCDYPTCQVQFQQKYPSPFQPSLAMLVAWLIADLMINPQIETYRLSFAHSSTFWSFQLLCILSFAHNIYFHPKNTREQNKVCCQISSPTNQHSCCQKLLSAVIQEIDLTVTS